MKIKESKYKIKVWDENNQPIINMFGEPKKLEKEIKEMFFKKVK